MEYFTVKQLKDGLGASEVTIRRWLDGNLFPGATKENNVSGWIIPVTALSNFILVKPKYKEKIKELIGETALHVPLSTKTETQVVASSKPIPQNKRVDPKKSKFHELNVPFFKEEEIEARVIYLFNMASGQIPDNDLVEFMTKAGVKGTIKALNYTFDYEERVEIVKNWNGFLRSYFKDNGNWTLDTVSGKKEKPKVNSSGSNKPIRRERTPEWLAERDKEHEQTNQISSEAVDLEEQRRRLQEELKQYQKKK